MDVIKTPYGYLVPSLTDAETWFLIRDRYPEVKIQINSMGGVLSDYKLDSNLKRKIIEYFIKDRDVVFEETEPTLKKDLSPEVMKIQRKRKKPLTMIEKVALMKKDGYGFHTDGL